MLLRWLLVAAIAAALLSFLRARQWRTFPLFMLYMAVAGFIAAAHMRIEQWSSASWVNWQYVLIGLRVSCALEILWRLTAKDRDRGVIRSALITAPIAIIWMVWTSAPALSIDRATAAVKHLEAGAVGMLLLLLMLPLSITTAPGHRRHAWLFAAWLANQIWPILVWENTAVQWQVIYAGACAVAITCAAGWALHSPRRVLVASIERQVPAAQI